MSLKRRILIVFEILGIRRRVLHLGYINWEQVAWGQIFYGNIWMRILYAYDCVDLETLESGADEGLADASIASIDAENYQQASYEGLLLWELCKTAILGALETTSLGNISANDLEVIKHFYRETLLVYLGSTVYMERSKPAILLVCQGCQHTVRPVLEAARRRGMVTVAAESSFSSDHFFCDNATGMILNRHSGSRLLGDRASAWQISIKQRDAVRQFVAALPAHKRKQHLTEGATKPDHIRGLLDIPTNHRIAVFIAQVMTDASVIMDSPLFPDPVELIRRVTEYFKHKRGWILVIRLHPKESTGGCWVGKDPALERFGIPCGKQGVPYNEITLRKLREAGVDQEPCVRIVVGQTVNTAALLDVADMGVTCNSQAGFEMALQYKPVVVAGDAFYTRKGFTIDVGHESGLAAALEYSVKNPVMPESDRWKADRFLYGLLNTCLFARDLSGQWARLLSLFEGSNQRGLRSWLLRLATSRLEANKFFFSKQDVE